jgi:hypothetical protein
MKQVILLATVVLVFASCGNTAMLPSSSELRYQTSGIIDNP